MQMTSGYIRRHWARFNDWGVLGLLTMSLAGNVYLGGRLSRTPIVAPPNFVAGMKAPPLYAQDQLGAPVSLQWTDSTVPVLLYVFSPSCPWCRRNAANFNLLAQSQSSHIRVVSLSLSDDGLGDYVRAHNLSGVVLSRLDRVKSRPYLKTMTPTTILISPGGMIERVWRGAYVGGVREELEKKFGIQLSEFASIGR